MRNLHGEVVFLTLVRLAETPMFTRVDWSTVLLRRRNSFDPPVLTKFAPPNRGLAHRKKRTASFEMDGWK